MEAEFQKSCRFQLLQLCCFFATALICACVFWFFCNLYQSHGLVLGDKAILKNLSVDEQTLLAGLIENGGVISTSDLLENFTTYYHNLISLLIAIVIGAVGFITFNFYRGQSEHNEILKYRLNILVKELQKNMDKTGLKEELQEYEDLNEYIRERVLQIVRANPDWVPEPLVKEEYQLYISEFFAAFEAEILSSVANMDDAVIEKLSQRIKAKEDMNKAKLTKPATKRSGDGIAKASTRKSKGDV